ncbi:GNAT family N-acetyltransferase [Actinoplanes sp. NPDC049681]|uniref:GNAT family N-acetyltransferase n=1 Tax=Actinoplanes sp. NPDC049681 TaxID=3363905 RepID=UPI0037B88D79
MEALDNPVWAALSGPQAAHADRLGRAARFDPEISPFAAVDDPTDPQAWQDLAKLVGPGSMALVAAPAVALPPEWTVTGGAPGVQLVGHDYQGEPDPEAQLLGADDLPEILDLVARTRPGPFRERTVTLGAYLGIRRDGELVAMAGERMRLPGHTEISAVCTDQAHRGTGLATRLIAAVAAGIRARGEVPFLHAAVENAGAVRLYERLGFEQRTPMQFIAATAP